ncbi:MAG TPA: hypothetical protein VHA33_07610 [Candidatus Angelobacter sp.]|jgi:hypothetical protein|nr:hypothetical protein [Candidatus Angelobacter sp.]
MGKLLNASSTMMCPHGGTVNVVTSNTKTKAGGDYALRSSDTFLIAGCPFMIGPNPHPCMQVQWVQTALKSTAMGDPTLTDESTGLCVAADKAPQGAVQIVVTQPTVSGT